MEQIRVLIADDHPLIREGVRKILDLEPAIAVVGEASDGEECIRVAREKKPDVILMDINMPRLNGIEATRILKQELPGTAIVILTIHEDERYLLQLIQAGCSGYILKDVDASRLIEAVHAAAQGKAVIHPALTAKVFAELKKQKRHRPAVQLTNRELEILSFLVKGSSNTEIAHRLFISEKTVKNHLTSIFRKLGVADRTQAVVYAIKERLVEF